MLGFSYLDPRFKRWREMIDGKTEKEPLPEFIESLYWKHFNKEKPDTVRSIEQMVKDKKRKQAERKAQKQEERDRQSGGR